MCGMGKINFKGWAKPDDPVYSEPWTVSLHPETNPLLRPLRQGDFENVPDGSHKQPISNAYLDGASLSRKPPPDEV